MITTTTTTTELITLPLVHVHGVIINILWLCFNVQDGDVPSVCTYYYHLCLLFFPADPTMPQYINSILKNDSSGKCFIQLSWAPPNNTAVNDISAYIIRINGRDAATKMDNIDRNLITDVYVLYSCDSYEYSIIALDRCNRRGQSTPSFMPDLPSIIRTLTSDNDLTTQPTDVQCPGIALYH